MNYYSLDLKLDDSQVPGILQQTSPNTLDSLVTSQTDLTSDLTTEVEDGRSSVNTNCTSNTDQDILDELDEEVSLVNQSPALVKYNEEPLLSGFNVDQLCKPGKTLLWDLVQDPHLVGFFLY